MLLSLAWMACKPSPSPPQRVLDGAEVGVLVQDSGRWEDGIDADGDGSPLPSDCNDQDPGVHPGAAEVCDGLDNDCDGLVDDADGDMAPLERSLWYPDEDGDGHGTGGAPVLSCAQPGYAASKDDCDDAAAHINPTAHENYLDAVDNDCDGAVDESAHRIAQDASIVLTGSGQDYLGQAVAIGDLNGDGADDWIVGAAQTEPTGEALVFLGPLRGGRLRPEDADLRITGDADLDPYLGKRVAVLQSPSATTGLLVTSALYDDRIRLFEGWRLGRIGANEATTEIRGDDYHLGWYELGDADDISGDGVSALIFSGTAYAQQSGAVFLFDQLPPGQLDAVEDASAIVVGSAGDFLGYSASYGVDMDGDGVSDVVPMADSTAYLVLGPVNGQVYAADLATVTFKASTGGRYKEVGVGDFDGDGHPDLALLALSTVDSPALRIEIHAAPLHTGGTVTARIEDDGDHDFLSLGGQGDLEGRDLDQDGFDDLFVSGVAVHTYQGAVYGFFGPLDGVMQPQDVGGLRIDAEAYRDTIGCTLAFGDLDGDGRTDLSTGTMFALETTAAYVLFGDAL